MPEATLTPPTVTEISTPPQSVTVESSPVLAPPPVEPSPSMPPVVTETPTIPNAFGPSIETAMPGVTLPSAPTEAMQPLVSEPPLNIPQTENTPNPLITIPPIPAENTGVTVDSLVAQQRAAGTTVSATFAPGIGEFKTQVGYPGQSEWNMGKPSQDAAPAVSAPQVGSGITPDNTSWNPAPDAGVLHPNPGVAESLAAEMGMANPTTPTLSADIPATVIPGVIREGSDIGLSSDGLASLDTKFIGALPSQEQTNSVLVEQPVASAETEILPASWGRRFLDRAKDLGRRKIVVPLTTYIQTHIPEIVLVTATLGGTGAAGEIITHAVPPSEASQPGPTIQIDQMPSAKFDVAMPQAPIEPVQPLSVVEQTTQLPEVGVEGVNFIRFKYPRGVPQSAEGLFKAQLALYNYEKNNPTALAELGVDVQSLGGKSVTTTATELNMADPRVNQLVLEGVGNFTRAYGQEAYKKALDKYGNGISTYSGNGVNKQGDAMIPLEVDEIKAPIVNDAFFETGTPIVQTTANATAV